jgi:hypothetical protein
MEEDKMSLEARGRAEEPGEPIFLFAENLTPEQINGLPPVGLYIPESYQHPISWLRNMVSMEKQYNICERDPVIGMRVSVVDGNNGAIMLEHSYSKPTKFDFNYEDDTTKFQNI